MQIFSDVAQIASHRVKELGSHGSGLAKLSS